MFDTIIYHKKCADGIVAAWVVLNHISDKGYYNPDLLPYQYGTLPPDLTGKSVAIVDFSFPRKEMEQIISQAKHVLVLDHHETAEKHLKGLKAPNLELIFDMKRSGAQLAWDFFHKGEATPWFILYVQDYDLWQFKLPGSKAVTECLWHEDWFRCIIIDGGGQTGVYGTFDKLNQLYSNFLKEGWRSDLSRMIEVGDTLLIPKQKRYLKYAKLSVKCRFNTPSANYVVRAINCPYEIRSEVCHKILELYDDCQFAIWWVYDLRKDLWICSLRNKKEGKRVNVAMVAEEFGGGGHSTSAGMSIKSEPLRKYLIPL